ncbi:MAG: lamin tail domain-containing protein [Phycisphaeraceae bacterium]|nr:lamin tail domain-containing protein [Phycisphaeraceae bacterium]
MNKQIAIGAAALVTAASSSMGAIRITEWMYNGAGGTAREYFEITNTGAFAIDLTGWSFDDDSRAPGTVSLSSLGILAAGESAIVCEPTAAAFRTAWGLAASVKVLGSNTTNLGRADEINIYDAFNNLIDRLTYDDQTIGGPRTQGFSGNIMLANLGANRADLALISSVGDAYGSWTNSFGEIGNPGTYADIPAPGVLALAGLGAVISGRRRRA